MHDFPLDPFQERAVAAVRSGSNVLVAAPTGAGKTVVAEAAVAEALRAGGKCFYTAPIKALSNQKFSDLRRALGPDRVGLLTGDHSINGDAPVVVMTTEVLRNMVYARSAALDGLGWVVLDEVHFLQDAYRGPVWEEVLIHTPGGTRFVCLSATVSNAGELGEWIGTLRGDTVTVTEHRRPIRLDPLMLVGDRTAERDHLVPLLVDGRPNPEGHRFDADPADRRGGPRRGGRRGRPRPRFVTPRRIETVDRLAEEELLPCIYFIFSRNGCDEAAARYLDGGARLTDAAERARIREVLEHRTSALEDSELSVLGYDRVAATLEHGVAAHHAGMVPAFREAVEDCFNEGLLKVVFATETLALGINMPARSVVIERLSKFTGEGHEMLSAGQFTQLTGRAGRRGLDPAGSAVVLWSPFVRFEEVAQLAASREFPLSSSFRPTYNMAANLIHRYERQDAAAVLERSFAQFQTDRAVVRLRARRDRLAGEIEAEEPSGPTAEALDVAGYLQLHEELREARRAARGHDTGAEASLRRLRPGDVVLRPTRRGARPLLVLSVSQRRGGTTRVRATTPGAHPVRLDAASAGGPLRVLTRVRLPMPARPQEPAYRRSAAAQLREALRDVEDAEAPEDPAPSAVDRLRRRIEEHPAHHHPDRENLVSRARTAERRRVELSRLDRDIRRRRSGLARQFDAILDVLARTGHAEGWALTAAGERLRGLYHESDLLVSAALTAGLLDGLEPADVAAVLSCTTYEHRSSEPPPPPVLPSAESRERVRRLAEVHETIVATEAAAGAPVTREPDAGFAAAAWAWASGAELDQVVDEDLTGGDFVRNVRQLVDLLRQVAQVAASPDTRRSAASAAEALVRGVIVAAGSPR